MSKTKSKKQQKVYRVGIDARFFGLENKGLGRYTNELIKWLEEIDKEIRKSNRFKKIEFYVFLRGNNFSEYIPQNKHFHKVLADFRWYSLAEQIKFPFLLNKYKLDLVHFPHFNVPLLYRKKFIVTVHDLILFHYPTVRNTTLNKLVYWFKLLMYHLVIRFAVRQSSLVIAISKFTKKDLVTTLNIPPQKIRVVYEGAEFNLSSGRNVSEKQGNAFLKKYGIIKPYLLYVGNAYPHKNLERLVLVFKKLVQSGFDKQLVLVGKNDYFYQRLKKFIQNNKVKQVVITDYIDDVDLEKLYRKAEAFVFPSLYEGFGLPPLEALIYGLPVISSNKSSLPEILGNQVRYFNPESEKEMMEAILKYSQQVKINKADIVGLKEKYSWQKMAREIYQIYLKVL